MSMSSLIIATSLGPTDYVALPVFTMRRFFHTNIVVRGDAGIATPAGLRGKRIGVPEYQQTSAVWTRGILADEFGVSAQDIVWYMERPPEASHGGTTGFVPPPGVELHYISPQTNIGEMLVNGGLDGSLSYLSAPNLIDRSRIDIHQHLAIGAESDVRDVMRRNRIAADRIDLEAGIVRVTNGELKRSAIRGVAEANLSECPA